MLARFLVLRYLRFDKTQPFISITAILAFLGVGVGVMVLIIAMAIMEGMIKHFEERLSIMNYPLTIFAKSAHSVNLGLLKSLERDFPALKFSPYVRTQGALKVGGSLSAGVVYGVDFQKEMAINKVLRESSAANLAGGNLGESFGESGRESSGESAESLGESGESKNAESSAPKSGESSATVQPYSGAVRQSPRLSEDSATSTTLDSAAIETAAIILGERLARGVNLAPHDKVTLIFTQLQANALSLTPTMKRFSLAGTFSSGLSAYDSSYMFVDIATLQKIRALPSGVYDGIHIFSPAPLKDIEALKSYLADKNIKAGVVGWWEQNGNFFSAIALEKRALFIVLMLIIVMAALNIISSLMMVVMTRRREIALLLSLGASKSEIHKTFFWLGNAIGFSGIVFGLVLAGAGLFLLSSFPIIELPTDVYGSTKLPLFIAPLDILGTIVGAILVVIAASFYPARKAANIDPLVTLRSE